MAYNRRRSSAVKLKTPMSVMSITTGCISFICILVLIVCFEYLVKNDVEPGMKILGVLTGNLIVSVVCLGLSLGELKKQSFELVTRIACFVISVIPVVAYVALYVFGFMF